MAVPDIVQTVIKDLEGQSDPVARESSRRFFKEEIRLHGVKATELLKITRQSFKELKGKGKKEIFALCERLLETGYWEESIIAFNWAYYIRDTFKPEDFAVLERWVSKYVSDWAECDTLCNHTVAAFIEMYPQYIANLKEWAKSENRWLRRAAAVTLILPARAGKYLEDIFEIARILLLDKEDLVQKGYGWMLKEASRKHQDEVFTYVMKNKEIMPRTALRYAIEKMPPELKAKAMQKNRK
jgi:3-methyladenine DNA glycosylase AlkD